VSKGERERERERELYQELSITGGLGRRQTAHGLCIILDAWSSLHGEELSPDSDQGLAGCFR
jgi:hypothetical protein